MMKVNQSMGFRFDSLLCDSDICKVGWPKQFGEPLLPLHSHPTPSTGSVKKERWGLIELEFPLSLSECSVGTVLCLRHPDRWCGGKSKVKEGFGYRQNRCQLF